MMILSKIEKCGKYTIKANDEIMIENNSFHCFKPKCIQVNSSNPSKIRSKENCVDIDVFGTISPDLPVVFLTNITQQGQEMTVGLEVQQRIVIRNNKDEDVFVSFN